MMFRRRMKKPIKRFNGLFFEATAWYHLETYAIKKSKEYNNRGFLTHVIYEKWFGGWFVYIRAIEVKL